MSETDMLHTESTFQQWLHNIDFAGCSSARGDLVSCVLYTKAIACLPLH